MKKSRLAKLQIVIVILISVLIGYYFGISKVTLDWRNYKPQLSVINKEPPAGIINVDFTPFWNVWQKLETDYYDRTKLDTQKMLNGAIEGMVATLDDPFTMYLPPADNSDFKSGLAGQFEGIGAELGLKDKQIIVIAPINGSPAQKAGIRAGDAILEVDGKSTYSWNLSQTVSKIRGPKDTLVTLNVLHKDAKTSTDIKITRGIITVKSVDSWVKKISDIDSVNLKQYKDQSIAYISLSQFGDNTNQDWLAMANALNLQIKNQQNVKGLVFDLRNNPGGYLSDATFVASEFLEQGATVVMEESGGARTTMTATRKGLFTDIPMVVLINKGSASASEIVSGALRDNKRAKLIGDTSFGKGTVQQAEDLGDGAGLHVTIAKWLTPNGTWVHGVGLTPDISVALDTKDPSHDTQLEKAITTLLQ